MTRPDPTLSAAQHPAAQDPVSGDPEEASMPAVSYTHLTLPTKA